MSTAINMAIGSSVLLGFGALSIDLGFANMARVQTQAAADSAALAGAISLASGDTKHLVEQAQTWGQSNQVGTSKVIVDETDVRRGTLQEGGNCEDFKDVATGRHVYARAHTLGINRFLSRIWGAGGLDAEACAVAEALPASVCTFVGTKKNVVNGGTSIIVGYNSELDFNPNNAPDLAAAICSNGDVDMKAGPTVKGNVRPGIGRVVNGKTMNVAGLTSSLAEQLLYNQPVFPVALKKWPLASYKITKATVIAPGNYEVGQDLSISGQGSLTIKPAGAVNLYSNGKKVTITGKGLVNPTKDPHKFAIYAKGTQLIMIGGSAAFYGYVYAPDAEVNLNGSAAFHGAVVSRELSINGGGSPPYVYMDRSLMKDVQEGGIRLVR